MKRHSLSYFMGYGLQTSRTPPLTSINGYGKRKEGDPKVKDFKGSSFFVWITPDGHNERMNA